MSIRWCRRNVQAASDMAKRGQMPCASLRSLGTQGQPQDVENATSKMCRIAV